MIAKITGGHRLILRELSRVAFAVCILIQTVLFAALIGLISHYWPSDVLAAVFFIGLFLIGAGYYWEFRWLTRVEYVLSESKRWLAERRKADLARIKRRRRLKRWAIWIPTVTVVLACLFLDATFALTSHLVHPGSFRLIGYRVSIPFDWTIGFSSPHKHATDTWSFVTANKTNGMLRAGLDFYLGRKPHLMFSEMAFYGAAGDQIQTNRDSPFWVDRLISSHRDLFPGGEITCSDYAPSQTDQDYREVACFASHGDFFCFVSGNDEDVQQFYGVLRGVQASH